MYTYPVLGGKVPGWGLKWGLNLYGDDVETMRGDELISGVIVGRKKRGSRSGLLGSERQVRSQHGDSEGGVEGAEGQAA